MVKSKSKPAWLVKGSPAAKARMKKVRAGVKFSKYTPKSKPKSKSKYISKSKPKSKAKAKVKAAFSNRTYHKQLYDDIEKERAAFIERKILANKGYKVYDDEFEKEPLKKRESIKDFIEKIKEKSD